jgi:magnesium chelatase subunit I
MLVFTANPEDYTARGKIITPLKDRIGSEIRTHYPESLEHALLITRQEAWEKRTVGDKEIHVPDFVREVVETVAMVAREDKKIDKRSGVSQRLPISCMENVISNAERRAYLCDENRVVPRIGDVYAALPSITGKFELEYEGELRGADRVARELIRTAVGRVFDKYFSQENLSQVVQWFELGGTLKISDDAASAEVVRQLESIQGLLETAGRLVDRDHHWPELRASAGEFVLDGLYSHRRLSRNEEVGYAAERHKPHEATERPEFPARGTGRSYN